MGFTEVLTIIFIVLKIVGVIDWSWFFVLLPEIIAFAIYTLAIVIGSGKTDDTKDDTDEKD